MEDTPLAEQNNNPGDLRDVGQTGAIQGKGGFAAFTSPQAGISALLNQIQTNINNKPNENIIDFASNYAPASDGNNVGEYASGIANQLGVSPLTPIGQLQSKVPQFGQAVAHLEDQNTPAPQASEISSGTSDAEVIGAGLLGAAGGALSVAKGSLPYVGSAGGAAIGTAIEPGIGTVIGAGLGGEAGAAAEGLLSGSSQTQTQAPETVTAPETEPNFLSGNNDYSGVSSAVNNSLSTTVANADILQEMKNRNIEGTPGNLVTKYGAVPSVDSNGNLDKISPVLLMNAANAQDANFRDEAAKGMQTPISLEDIEKSAQENLRGSMKTTDPDLSPAQDKIHELVDRVRKQRQDAGQDTNLTPAEALAFRKEITTNKNWKTQPYSTQETLARRSLYHSAKKHLSVRAKKEGIKGWDETDRRMEERQMVKKIIKKLPKKAQRDLKREFIHDLVTGLGGAVIGRTMGNGILGGTAGYLLGVQLGGKHYKSFGSKKEQKKLEKRGQEKPKSLLFKTPNNKSAANNKKKKVKHT